MRVVRRRLCVQYRSGGHPRSLELVKELVGISVPGERVEILFDGRTLTSVHTDSALGKLQFKSVHPDAQFLSVRQFRVFRDAGCWMIEHMSGATNETIVDGHKLARPEAIRDPKVRAEISRRHDSVPVEK